MRWSASDLSARSDAISSMVGVTSTVWNVVTCGAVKALRTIASAVNLRTPRIGMRVVRLASSREGAAGRRRGRGRGGGAGAGAATRDGVGLDVGAGDEARLAGALDEGEVDAEVLGELAHGRGRARALDRRLVRELRLAQHVVRRGLEHGGVDGAGIGPGAARPARGTAGRRGSRAVADEVRRRLLRLRRLGGRRRGAGRSRRGRRR